MTVAEVLAAAPRFWAKVARGPRRACWPWTHSTYQGGYAQFHVRPGLNTRGHRFAWILGDGRPAGIRRRLRLARGKEIRHGCDNRPCCNRRHLLRGTGADNRRDAHRRHRYLGGTRHPQAKLDAQQLRLLTRMVATMSTTDVARALGVHKSTVSRAARAVTYKLEREQPARRPTCTSIA